MKRDYSCFLICPLLFCIVCGYIFSPAAAMAGKINMEEFEVEGYIIDVSVQQKDGKIRIRGRVSYGPVCDRLKITFTLENEEGKSKKISEVVKDAGGSASRTIRAEKKVVKGKVNKSEDMEWEITKVTADCKK